MVAPALAGHPPHLRARAGLAGAAPTGNPPEPPKPSGVCGDWGHAGGLSPAARGGGTAGDMAGLGTRGQEDEGTWTERHGDMGTRGKPERLFPLPKRHRDVLENVPGPPHPDSPSATATVPSPRRATIPAPSLVPEGLGPGWDASAALGAPASPEPFSCHINPPRPPGKGARAPRPRQVGSPAAVTAAGDPGGHPWDPPSGTAASPGESSGMEPPMAEPGSSCPHGRDGANVTPATWHRTLALSLSPSPAAGPPLSERVQAAPPELRRCREDGGAPEGSPRGDRARGVTGVAGGGHSTHHLPWRFHGPAGGSNVPPGLPLRLPAPFTAAVYSPAPCPLSLSPPHRPPGGDTGSEPPRTPPASYQGRPAPETGTGHGADPAVTLGGSVTHRACPEVAPVAGSPLGTPRVPPMGAPARPLQHAAGAGGRPEPHGDLHIKSRLICILRTVS
ncbi:basic salivary proline-rich protein 2-like [Serinus canaria]|uniref:basic salivary proline-rich protein 2-like n=1 Tax=Serinus canaria TaxID=9135 RepID=UPI0021CC7F34|nr:basic salivary proline-rich protein 2-like [Serinus canaria]